MSNAIQMGAFQGAAYVISFKSLKRMDVDSVDGKNASLGEMISQPDAVDNLGKSGVSATRAALGRGLLWSCQRHDQINHQFMQDPQQNQRRKRRQIHTAD